MNAATELKARDWCEAFAARCRCQVIEPSGRSYLERYFAGGWNPWDGRPGPAIFLHHFVASDPNDAVHSHPWGWSASLILAGGYREERCGPDGRVIVRECRPGDVNVLEADDQHRIDLLATDCWSVFLAGNFEKGWRFAPRCGP